MEKLQATSDVVCLFTERSLDRPWLLFEAGVAKGKLNTPVVDIAEDTEESSFAKLIEEMKTLPSRVAERLSESGDSMMRRRRMRRFHPMMFDDLMHMSAEPGDPVAVLVAASLTRDDMP